MFDDEAAQLCGSNQDPALVRFARKCIDYGRGTWLTGTPPEDGYYIVFLPGRIPNAVLGAFFDRGAWSMDEFGSELFGITHYRRFPDPPTI